MSVTRDYVQTTVRLSPEMKARLDAVASLEQLDRSSVIDAALSAYVAALPAADRNAVEQLATRVRKRSR